MSSPETWAAWGRMAPPDSLRFFLGEDESFREARPGCQLDISLELHPRGVSLERHPRGVCDVHLTTRDEE